MEITDADPSMASSLTELAMRSKASWGYNSTWIALWQKDLTITSDYIQRHFVKVAKDGSRLVAFAALNLEDHEIDHFWVEPGCVQSGVGRLLFEAIKKAIAEKNIREIEIVSDPNAEGFYHWMGAEKVGIVDSVPNGRQLPKLIYRLHQETEQTHGANALLRAAHG